MIVGYEYYTSEKIRALCGDNRIKGVILGDFFCQKRMFDNAIADLILSVNQVLSSKKTVVYQTPLYVTSRNLDEVRSVLHLINSYDKKSYAIVQDFGTAELISGNYRNIDLIWGQLGRVRELRFSDDFLSFLSEKNFYGMETADYKLAQRISASGLIPFFGTVMIRYQTLGRQCYLEYQTGICDPEYCRKGCYHMRAENEDYEMTIDGYMMGKKYQKTPQTYIDKAAAELNAELICRNEYPL